MDIYNYGSTLKKIRKELNLSQKEASDNICSQAMLSRIENNEVIPNVVIMQELCERLNISIDDVMSQKNVHAPFQKQANEWLALMRYYHRTEQYKNLTTVISNRNIPELFSTKEQFQDYYYYKACALIFSEPFSDLGLSMFQQSLNYTYKPDKTDVSDIEIMIISEIGKTYLNRDETEKGLSLINQSVKYFHQKPGSRNRQELVRVLYNAGVAYINDNQYDKALEVINEGIAWAKNKQIYYYLDQLFLLKGIILQDEQKINDAIKYVDIANTLKALATS